MNESGLTTICKSHTSSAWRKTVFFIGLAWLSVTLLLQIIFYLTDGASSSSTGGEIGLATAMIAAPFYYPSWVVITMFHFDFGDRSSIQSVCFVLFINLLLYLIVVALISAVARLVIWLGGVSKK